MGWISQTNGICAQPLKKHSPTKGGSIVKSDIHEEDETVLPMVPGGKPLQRCIWTSKNDPENNAALSCRRNESEGEKAMIRRYVLSILVEKSSGVLSKVTGLFSRRGYNIRSLSVGETHDPKISRITIELVGDKAYRADPKAARQADRSNQDPRACAPKARSVENYTVVKVKSNAKKRRSW